MKKTTLHSILAGFIVTSLLVLPTAVFAGDGNVPNQSKPAPAPPMPQITPAANKATNLWEYYTASGKSLPPMSERAEMYQALGLC